MGSKVKSVTLGSARAKLYCSIYSPTQRAATLVERWMGTKGLDAKSGYPDYTIIYLPTQRTATLVGRWMGTKGLDAKSGQASNTTLGTGAYIAKPLHNTAVLNCST